MLATRTMYYREQASQMWLRRFWPEPEQQPAREKQRPKVACTCHSTQAHLSKNGNKTRSSSSSTHRKENYKGTSYIAKIM